MKTTAFSNMTKITDKSIRSFSETSTIKSNIIIASDIEALCLIDVIFRNKNIAALMIAISETIMPSNNSQLEFDLQMAINEAALFAMTDIFESDSKRLEYLADTLLAIKGFYNDGYRIILNPNQDNK